MEISSIQCQFVFVLRFVFLIIQYSDQMNLFIFTKSHLFIQFISFVVTHLYRDEERMNEKLVYIPKS